MGGDRTIMPSEARLRRGWRAGVRRQSSWIDAAASMAAVGLVLGAIPWSMAAGFGARWREAVSNPARATAWLLDLASVALVLVLALAVAFGLARLIAAALTGRLGPTDHALHRRLGVAPSRWGFGTLIAVGLGATLVLSWSLRGVLAAAARGVDASATGLSSVWTAWPQLAWTATVVVLGLAGWVELMLSSRRTRLRLAQSPQQVREDIRARGGRR